MKKINRAIIILAIISILIPVWAFSAPAELFGTSLIADIAEKVSPAVVAIEAVQYVRTRRSFGSGDPFFDRFFGHLFDDDFMGFNNVIPRKGKGSGVLISPQGHLLTNEHVIGGADEILVKLNDGTQVKAKLVGKDTRTDLAVLKIDSDKSLPHVPIGDSDKIRVGEWVVAIGNPFGLGMTVTAGVVSARNRDLSIDANRSYKDLIQTDASINPGNSGGALLNSKGELIGINTAIIPYGQGIGFAIPVNLAKRIVGDLMAYGKVKKAFLGVTVQKLTPELAAYFEVPEKGVLVTDVVEDSPADKAGIVPGDVIIAIEDKNIDTLSDFQNSLEEHRVGETATIKIFRKGREGICKVVFKENPAEKNALGVLVKKITPELEKKFSLFVTQGCVIHAVATGSPADNAGLRPGDVIQQINRVRVGNEDEFAAALKESEKAGTMVLRVVRGQTVNLLLVQLK
ncbi:MAG: serine protease Do [Clostridiales bacterium]|nr:serine protease Do [Clostridiales bacterium]MDN5282444.1 serine protease Do [Candidatus Ozemobacter sp.]